VLISPTGSQALESDEIKLWCSILGPSVERLFSVDILRDRTVGHLKDAIKKEVAPRLNHIAASSLDIWKVSKPARPNHDW